eukprot:TRINITY_DN2268_c0_g1_i1.p1 TRINITY_DN2268_c0_g1~~TRINITY_DN2268_c0_g1_i1.p1  ORF type:complete len:220 (-),score=47.56 TRINITY_DN2268_c0_g1_i1:108-767(-)
MRRFFGSSKPAAPAPTLTEAVERVDKRVEVLDERIRKMDAELSRYRTQMSKMRPGPAQNGVKQRALKILKQKKMCEQQRDQLMGQSFTLEQTNMMNDQLKDTVTIVDTLKATSKTMKATFKQVDINDVENLHDELEDMYETSNEIQEVLSRSYGTPDELDEADLEAELEALGDELELEGEEAAPSYLAAVSAPTDPVGAPRQPVSAADFGMPAVPLETL